MKVKKAVIPAAGLGTRFLPATKAQPKEMLPIIDIPTIQHIIQEAVDSGIEDILIITGRNKKSIEDHFDKSFELETTLEQKGKRELLEGVQKISNMVNLHFVRQKEAKGLGHAILCAKSFVGDEPFAVLLGDDIVYNAEKPCLKQLVECFEDKSSSVLGVQKVDFENVNKYGILKCEEVGEYTYKVSDMVEKPNKEEAPSNVAILGRYVITPKIFELLESTKPGKGGEIQLTDALKELLNYESVYGYVFQGRRYDVGDKQGFLEATCEFALRDEKLREGFKKYLKELNERDYIL